MRRWLAVAVVVLASARLAAADDAWTPLEATPAIVNAGAHLAMYDVA